MAGSEVAATQADNDQVDTAEKDALVASRLGEIEAEETAVDGVRRSKTTTESSTWVGRKRYTTRMAQKKSKRPLASVSHMRMPSPSTSALYCMTQPPRAPELQNMHVIPVSLSGPL